jgi:hypothetical protein
LVEAEDDFRLRAERAPLHRTQDLHVADGIEPEPFRYSVADDLDYFRRGLFRLLHLDKEEIRVFAKSRPLRHLTPIDTVSVDDDPAFWRLPKNLRQSRDCYCPGSDNVTERLTRTDGRKLIDVANEQQRCVRCNRFHDREHERRVHHAGFVDDQQITFERVLSFTSETARLRIGLEQPMNGPRLYGHTSNRAMASELTKSRVKEEKTLPWE